MHTDVNSFSWCMLVCGHLEKSLDILTDEFNFDEREILLEKFVMAKILWMCKKCSDRVEGGDGGTTAASNPVKTSTSISSVSNKSNNQNVVELMLSGYIECRLCRHWFHRLCCLPQPQLTNDGTPAEQASLDDEHFVCEGCTALFVIQVQQNPQHHQNELIHQQIKKVSGMSYCILCMFRSASLFLVKSKSNFPIKYNIYFPG